MKKENVVYPQMVHGKSEVMPPTTEGATVISLNSKKCLDAEILSDKCQQCQNWQARTNYPKYNEWKATNNCKVNHTGSANSMETVACALWIFERTLATKGHEYKDMLGDGDSATYNTIVEN